MSTEPALDLTNLKDINSKLFEIQSKSVLYECMKNELDKRMSHGMEERATLGKLKEAQQARKDDLEKALESKLQTFDRLLSLKQKLDFLKAFSKDTKQDDEVRGATRHLHLLSNVVHELDRNYNENPIVRELNRIKGKISHLKDEHQKYSQALTKLDKLQQRELTEILDRRNKTILDMVIIWAERRALTGRQAENRHRFTQLQKDNKDLLTRIQEKEKRQYTLITESTVVAPIPILDSIPTFRYESTASRPTNKRIFSPDLDTSMPIRSPMSSSAESSSSTGQPVSKKRLLTAKSTPTKSPKGGKSKCVPSPPAVVTRAKAKIRSPATVAQSVKDAETSQEPIVAPQSLDSSQPAEVVNSPPSSPTKLDTSAQSNSMGLDDDLTHFESALSSPATMMSPSGVSEDMNCSFFGGGGAGGNPSDAENWF